MKTRVKRMGVRHFVLYVRKVHGIDPAVTRIIMLAWRDWMLMHLTQGRKVYQEHVGTYRLTKRRTGRPNRMLIDLNGVVHHLTLPPFSIYVTFKPASRLRNTIKKTFNDTEPIRRSLPPS